MIKFNIFQARQTFNCGTEPKANTQILLKTDSLQEAHSLEIHKQPNHTILFVMVWKHGEGTFTVSLI